MIIITREEGKLLKQICPKYVHSTVHNRTYYLVEVREAFEELFKIRSKHRVVETYPEPWKGNKRRA